MSISISNQQDKVPFSSRLEGLMIRVAETIIEREGVSPNLEVAILLVDDLEIQKFNLDYRGMDSPTDVLSFAYQEDNPGEPEYEKLFEEDALGDIIISLESAKNQGREYGHSLERELGFLVAHGMYHLLGYDHQDSREERIMRAKEEQVLALIGLGR